MRLAMAVLGFGLASVPAQAGVADYCAAYARDFADKVMQQGAEWQHRYESAEQSCLLRFAAEDRPVTKAKSKTKVVVASKSEEPITKAKVKAEPVAEASDVQPQEQQVAKVKPKLEPGSAEWIAYCKKKYVSFDEAKGTYQSKTGIERKCLVTAD